jgi:hypothetical protein
LRIDRVLFLGEVAHLHIGADPNAAHDWIEQPGNRPDQRRLAAAVGPENRYLVTMGDVQGNIFQDRLAVIPEAGMFDDHHVAGALDWRDELDGEAPFLLRLLDVLG